MVVVRELKHPQLHSNPPSFFFFLSFLFSRPSTVFTFPDNRGSLEKEFLPFSNFQSFIKDWSRNGKVKGKEKKTRKKKQEVEKKPELLLSSSHVEIDDGSSRCPPAPSRRSCCFCCFSARRSHVHALQAAADYHAAAGGVKRRDVDAESRKRKRSRRRRGSSCSRHRCFRFRFRSRRRRLHCYCSTDGPALRRRHGRRQAVVPGRRARGRARGRQAAGAARPDADRGLRLPRGPRGGQGLGRHGQAARVQDARRVLQHLNLRMKERKRRTRKRKKSGGRKRDESIASLPPPSNLFFFPFSFSPSSLPFPSLLPHRHHHLIITAVPPPLPRNP